MAPQRTTMLLLALVPTLPLVTAICENECSSATSLLSSCTLPSLDTDEAAARENYIHRNVTGLPKEISIVADGPSTYFVQDYAQAACFCTDARIDLIPCLQCYASDAFEDETTDSLQNNGQIARLYLADCREFGYYANETISYPSTTRDSFPSKTTFPASISVSLIPGDDCKAACGVVAGQVDQCGLTPLDADQEPRQTAIVSGNAHYYGKLLLNRTAAECVCTKPALRRFNTCARCMNRNPMARPRQIVLDYAFDCEAMGYWTDKEHVFAQQEETPTVAQPVPTPTPTKSGAVAYFGRELWSPVMMVLLFLAAVVVL